MKSQFGWTILKVLNESIKLIYVSPKTSESMVNGFGISFKHRTMILNNYL